MKDKLTPLLLLLSSALHAQTVEDYFQKIRNDAAALTVFFSQMPKGGDLHHHFSGSIYAETFLDTAFVKGFYVNPQTTDVAETKPKNGKGWVRLSDFKTQKSRDSLRVKLLRRWSVKDYDGTEPAAERFFNAFGRFGPVAKYATEGGFKEIKKRAVAERASYIETSVWGTGCAVEFDNPARINRRLQGLMLTTDTQGVNALLDTLWRKIKTVQTKCVSAYKQQLHQLHRNLQLEDSVFVLRFQSAANRNLEPVPFFISLAGAFEAAHNDPLIVGLTILAPEHYEIALRDYRLHMQMFAFLRTKYGGVKCSLHAGELTLGLAKPEDLGWHITEAVHTAAADRIGHGVDLPYEKDAAVLLDTMKRKGVLVEINLTSNEFILGVKDDRHPVLLYKAAGVPIAISTDDAGILRTSLTEQFVLLAKRYPSVSYADIKSFVFNSIVHSFINQQDLKDSLREKLKTAFDWFEEAVLRLQKK